MEKRAAKKIPRETKTEYIALILIIFVTAIFRFIQFLDLLYVPLANDNLGYFLGAQTVFTANYNDFREPGFSIFLNLIFSFGGASGITQRLTTTILSIIIVLIIYFVARILTGNRYIAILSSLLMTFESSSIINCANGLREELLTIMLIVTFILAHKKEENQSRIREIGSLILLGFFSGYSALISLTTSIRFFLSLVFSLLVRLNWSKKQEEDLLKVLSLKNQLFRKVGVVLLAFIGVYIYWSIYCQIHFGYWDIISRFQATFFYAVETGVPMPIEPNNYITLFDFIFNVRPFSTTIRYFFWGFYYQIYTYFIQFPFLSTFSFIGSIFLFYGLFKSPKSNTTFFLILFGVQFSILALFSVYTVIYRYYLQLKIFEIIMISTGFVEMYELLKKKEFSISIHLWFLDSIFEKLNKITKNRIKNQCIIHISRPVIFFLMLVFMLYFSVHNVTSVEGQLFIILIVFCSIFAFITIIINSFFEIKWGKNRIS